MIRRIRKFYRGLAFAVLIVAAGVCYSCGREDSEEIWMDQTEAASEDFEEAALEQETVQEPQTGQKVVCFVHVCGEVRAPGVYELCEGQRIYEAISLAGGFTEEAARDYLNLAEPVWDGMKLEIPHQEQVSQAQWPADYRDVPQAGMSQAGQTGAARKGGEDSSGKVNLNTGTKEELMTLRGIGEARAEEIIRYREERGGFDCIEDIMEISGIKDGAFQKIKDDITV